MSKPKFNSPHINDHKAEDLNLSNDALLSLMRAVLEKGLPFRFRARGWSMSPFIKDGDVITVSPLRDIQPGLGDVIAFTHPLKKRVIVHRVIGKKRADFIIHGDSVDENPHDIVPCQNLLGQVIEVNRNGKNVWLGLGLERYFIAWFSRAGLLIPFSRLLAYWYKRLKRKH